MSLLFHPSPSDRLKTISFGISLLILGLIFSSPLMGQHSSNESARIWKDASGKFEVKAELLSHDENEVLLKTEDGKKIRVQKDRLSNSDLDYLKTLNKTPNKTPDKANDNESSDNAEIILTLKDRALEFFDDLRTKERNIALSLLSPAAQETAKNQQSSLNSLPTPDEGKQSIRVGKPSLKDNEARIPVTVRVNKQNHKTTIYFKKDDQNDWQVVALSTISQNKEAKIDFESSSDAGENKKTLASLVGQSVDLTGVTLDGKPMSLVSLKGKVVLIDFWATWCGPCRAEIPNILENYEKYQDKGFEVLAVSTDKDLDALKKFVNEEQPPWIVLADRHPKNKESMAAKFGITGIPAFILIDRDGKVYAVNCRGAQLGKKLEELFGSEVSLETND